MGYLIYLAGLILCLSYGIRLDRICNFIDAISFGFVVIPCILVLICMGCWKEFIRAFMYIFDQKTHEKRDVNESARAVKLACISSLIFGGLGVAISLINALRGLNIEPSSYIGADLSVALISIFYALIINAVLVPLYFKLKGSIRNKSRY